MYAWLVLFIVFAARAINQLHRQAISFAFGYSGLGDKANNPKYMISVDYPQMNKYFGLIASWMFSSSYSTLGVYAGILSGKMNRKVLLGLSCIGWCATTYLAGAVYSFPFFILMRFFLGAFESACNPASYSIIADYFPPAYRSTANAIETSGSYVGGGMACLCVLLIKQFGWRVMYQIIGAAGMLLGLLILMLVKEPQRGVFDMQAGGAEDERTAPLNPSEDELPEPVKKKSPITEFVDALKTVVTNKTARYITIAGCFRFWETFSIVYFLPAFF
jgi:sugar phosphate permease